MSALHQLLDQLDAADIRLRRDGDRLHVDAPAGAVTPALRREMVAHKAALLDWLAQRETAAQPILPAPPDATLPATPGQQRFWFLEQLAPGEGAYHLSQTYRLRGSLDVAALQAAVTAIVDRHAVLRTGFALTDDGLTQRVRPPAAVPPARVDVATAADPAAAARTWGNDLVKRPFDLRRDTLLRWGLATLGVDDHVIVVVIHHIAADGWSNAVFWRELGQLYAGATDLPPLPVQYGDFAHWQQERLRGPALAREVAFWRRQLDGAPALDLVTDRLRPPLPTFRGESLSFAVPAALAERVRAFASAERATPFMVLLATFAAVLGRYADQDDLVIGTPFANRTRAELEPLIGLFMNVLALRTDLGGAPSLRELVRRARRTVLDATEHQDLPYEQLIAELGQPRAVNRNPLFEVLFALQNQPPAVPELAGLDVAPFSRGETAVRFDLELYLHERSGGYDGSLVFNRDLYDRARLAAFPAHFSRLLDAAMAAPDRPLAQLPLDDAPPVMALPDPAAGDRLIHAGFEAQAARTPDAVAIVDGERRLTFGELNRAANRWAHHLRELGVFAEMRVGLCLPRSAEALICLLAVLKAGGAYVPLDPTYPATRLRLMLDDAGAELVMTTRALADRLPPFAGQLLYVDDGAPATVTVDPPPVTTPDSAAYIIYTSGSTGTPKGVVGVHRSSVNRFAWMMRHYPLGPGDVACHKTSLNFVDSIWEIFEPLGAGVPLVVVPDDVLIDPTRLVPLLARHQVSRFILVPSLLRLILDAVPDLGRRLPRLKLWIASGEALPRDLVLAFRVADGGTLLNLYGLTEAWDVSCYDTAAYEASRPNVPIGAPIDNVQVHILDSAQRPAPPGVPGELYVGGASVARGYWQRPELTAERFVTLTLPGSEAPRRLLRTGDRARWLADGTIEHLGRRDAQVKVRGHRIETGEVEIALRALPQVRDAAVVLRDDVLTAYVVAEGGAGLEPSAVRRELATRLPAVMVPAAYVALPALPLTPSGKVNRRALRAREDEAAVVVPAEAAERPPTELECALLEIWRAFFPKRSVGLDDDFFALGGHSLLGARLFGRIETRLGVHLPVATLFSAPTVAQLAAVIEEGDSDSGRARPHSPAASGAGADRAVRQKSLAALETVVPIQPDGDRTPLFVVHGFGGGVLGYHALARRLGPAQPLFGLQAIGLDGVTPPLTDIGAMADHYIDAMRARQPAGPYRLGGYCYGGIVAYEMACRLAAMGETVDLLAIFEGYAVRPYTGPPSWTARRVAQFVWNLPFWARDELQRPDGFERLVSRVRNKLLRRPGPAAGEPGDQPRVFHAAAVEDAGPSTAEMSAEPLPHASGDALVRRMKLAELKALRGYAPAPYPGRVTLFRVRAYRLFDEYEPTLGWGRLAQGGVDVRRIAGAHYNIMEEPHVASLAAALAPDLAGASQHIRA